MKVLRGPAQDPGYPATQLVDVVDLTKESVPWTGEKRISFVVSKETARSRRAQAHIFLTEDDVLALYAALVQGWRSKISRLGANEEG